MNVGVWYQNDICYASIVREDPCDQSLLLFRVPCNSIAVFFADFVASQDD